MTLTTREVDDVVIIDIGGDLRRSQAQGPSLPSIVKGKLEEGKIKLLLNFEKVDFVDSWGIGEILSSCILVHNQGGKLKLAASRLERLGLLGRGSHPAADLYWNIEDAIADYVAPNKKMAPKKTLKKWWQFWRMNKK